MIGYRWIRWAPLSGVVFVALWIITFILTGNGAGDQDQEILDYYAKHSNRVKEITGFFLILAASLFLLWFFGLLRDRLLRVEGQPGTLSTLAFAGGVGTAILLVIAGAMFDGTALTISNEKHFRLDPNTHRLINDIGYSFFVAAVAFAIFPVAVTSVFAIRGLVLSKWFGWLGLVAALTFIVGFAFIPFLVLLGWVLVASALMLWRPGGESSAQTAVGPT